MILKPALTFLQKLSSRPKKIEKPLYTLLRYYNRRYQSELTFGLLQACFNKILKCLYLCKHLYSAYFSSSACWGVAHFRAYRLSKQATTILVAELQWKHS
ncbi:hypothetical protein SGRA_0962 [Saprospira grandis str. Lewin]|uniref:Uncharacterized protein n=1 Tax=Saprospira grandis (strain Lewin) TaxID=984262 RepID=H6L2X1_SAPGL|nr:hypothetical protein SGRA_0962 [Saprospira grandis str. Lewin]